jgi:hypothetical protein
MPSDMKLSPAATTALINAGSSAQGTVVRAGGQVMFELRALNLIGPSDGLTRFGAIARERAITAALESAFG